MITVKNLELKLKKDLRVLISDLSFTLERGDKVAVIGEEGNGKSTLIKAIHDRKTIDDYVYVSGVINTAGERIAYLPQGFFEDDRDESVYEFLNRRAGLDMLIWEDINRIAKELSLSTDLLYSDEPMEGLSGGERIKVALFVLLSSNPTTLLLDEPTNDLDQPSRQAIIDLINSFAGIVVFVSHDELLLSECANSIVHIEQAHKKSQPLVTFEKIGYESYVTQRLKMLERQSFLADEQQRQKEIRDRKYNRIYQNVANQLQATGSNNPAAGKNLKDKMHAIKAMGRRYQKEDQDTVSKPHPEEELTLRLSQRISKKEGHPLFLIDIKDLKNKGRSLAKGIHLEIDAGDKIAIVGNNGIGKTTLMNELWRTIAKDKTINSFYMPQDYYELVSKDITPISFVCSNSPQKGEQEKAASLLGLTGLLFSEMNSPMGQLSGGETAKVIFAKMAYEDYDFLLMDEPTRNISPLQLNAIRRMLKDFKGTLLFVSHDYETVKEVADRTYELSSQGLGPCESGE